MSDTYNETEIRAILEKLTPEDLHKVWQIVKVLEEKQTQQEENAE